MDIEYLEYEIEIIDLNDPAVDPADIQANEATAEAIFTSWFTDWRNRQGAGSNVIAS